MFPFSTLLAEMLVVQLPPSVFACVMIYPAVSSRFSWTSFMRFLYIFTLIILSRFSSILGSATEVDNILSILQFLSGKGDLRREECALGP